MCSMTGSSATGHRSVAILEVVSLPEAMEPLVEYYRSISGEHPDWDDYRTAMIKQRRCLIRITPTKAGPTIFG